MRPRLDAGATDQLVATASAIREDSDAAVFAARQRLVRLLGARHDPDSGLTSFGFWAPELAEQRVPERDVVLEIFTAVEPLDLTAPRLAAVMERDHIHLTRLGDYWFGVVDGVVAGDAERVGAFYWLRTPGADIPPVVVHDILAHSIPYGSFAPAEVYDVASLQRKRRDIGHFARPAEPPTSILELHIPTATAEGTVGALAEVYEGIAARLARGEDLTPAEQVYVAYDAIQPLPVDPTIERRGGAPPFEVVDVVDEMAGLVEVQLHHPENQDWGYDNIVASSSATNPSLLGTRRPAELVRLAEALHALPEPMMLLYDIVYGHADNQALEVLPSRFFKGPNMYGQDLNHQDPTVRAILLEMQRRRMDTGCDGLRVDGAQDFKFYDPRTGRVEYDDDYLQSMSDVVQEIGPHRRNVWMIFEDGRPWPAEGWETSSTYRDVIEQQPDIWQWGPLIFAHNTPMLEGFWTDKWWRVEEIVTHGGRWISGCANHDTVRRGTQVDPQRPINRHLGDDLPTILDNAYDNEAVTVVSYGLLPGIPMDFLNATTRTPWGFMRTTDDLYGVKVMTEEAGFLDWQLTDAEFDREDVFARTKRHGFATKVALREFLGALGDLVAQTDYDLDAMALGVDAPGEMRPGRDGLFLLAYDFMRDVHDLCNVATGLGGLSELDADRVGFATRMREFRRAQRWLGEDCGDADVVANLDGDQTIYRGHRVAPGDGPTVAVVANMAGPTWEGSLSELLTTDREDAPDHLVVSPSASLMGDALVLPDGTGVLAVWDG